MGSRFVASSAGSPSGTVTRDRLAGAFQELFIQQGNKKEELLTLSRNSAAGV